MVDKLFINFITRYISETWKSQPLIFFQPKLNIKNNDEIKIIQIISLTLVVCVHGHIAQNVIKFHYIKLGNLLEKAVAANYEQFIKKWELKDEI